MQAGLFGKRRSGCGLNALEDFGGLGDGGGGGFFRRVSIGVGTGAAEEAGSGRVACGGEEGEPCAAPGAVTGAAALLLVLLLILVSRESRAKRSSPTASHVLTALRLILRLRNETLHSVG